MAVNGFPRLDKEELRRMTSEASSRAIVAAFKEARRELRRRGERANWSDVGRELSFSTSAFQQASNHLRAIDNYGISKRLSKEEAIKRMRLVGEAPGRLVADVDDVEDEREDPEILADAVLSAILRSSAGLTDIDPGVITEFLRRDPLKRGGAKSALIDLIKWLNKMEKAL